jgi:hypothetical protein
MQDNIFKLLTTSQAAQRLGLSVSTLCKWRLTGDGPTFVKLGASVRYNALARRVLIEGAWTYRMQARVSGKLHDQLERLPQVVRDIAWKAQVRLCARYSRLAATGKAKVGVTTAIAREMVGFLWAIARQAQARSRSLIQLCKQTGVQGWRQGAVGSPRACYKPAFPALAF